MTDAFAEIVVLALGRSGTNLLMESLRAMDGNLGLFEIFNPDTRGGLEYHPEFLARLGSGQFTGRDDPALAALIQADQAEYFAHLAQVAQQLGKTSLTCKIFPEQISEAALAQILNRPNVRILFLTRCRIDRYMSDIKGEITNDYVTQDTTALKPDFNLAKCLATLADKDRLIERFLDLAQESGRPMALLDYDLDLNQPDHRRHAAITDALRQIGVTGALPLQSAPNWLSKQDKNPNWRAKIKDGFAAAAALQALGLLDYVESAPLMDRLPSVTGAANPKIAYRSAATLTANHRDILAQVWGNFECLSADPMVTFSTIQNHRAPLAEWMIGPKPGFAASKGVHFLRSTWSMQTMRLDGLAQSIHLAEQDNPGHMFIALHVNAAESANFHRSGIRSIAGNSAIFVDESGWSVDDPPHPDIPSADAVMIAGLQDWKNHHLAAGLDAPHFIYAAPNDAQIAKVRTHCPSAHMINHILGKGQYHRLSSAEIGSVFSRAKVSLALSLEEGVHRGSIESLLAGLPMVSVDSIGGRDAYYCDDNALIVAATAQAVREGVAQMVARQLDRAQVRRATLNLLLPERQYFERVANAVVQTHLGPLAPEIRVRDLFSIVTKYRKLGSMVAGLQ